MIYDKEMMWADDTPVGDAAVSLDLGEGYRKGVGETILVNVRGNGLVADGGLDYKVVVTGSSDDASFFAEMEVQMGQNTANAGGITFGLSSAVSRYVKVELFGFTSGDWTCGVVLGVYP